jgi:hypothetical protein
MKMSDQLHASPALSLGKEPAVIICQKDVLFSEAFGYNEGELNNATPYRLA